MKRSVTNIFRYAIVMMSFVAIARNVNAQDKDFSDKDSKDSGEPEKHVFHLHPPGEGEKRPGDYAKYRRDFETLCSAFEADGRRDFVYTTLTAVFGYDKNCIDCRPFLIAFATACKPKRIIIVPTPVADAADSGDAEQSSSAASSSSAPKEKFPARLPTLETDDLLSELMRRMVNDNEHADETIKAIDKLSAALVHPDGQAPGEHEYAEALVAYMQAPFVEMRAKATIAAKAAAKAKGNNAVGGDQTPGTAGLFDP